MRLVLRSRAALAALAGTAALALAWACSQSPSSVGAGVNGPTGGSCAAPAAGCACPTEGASVACGDVIGRNTDSVTCVVGKRTCQSGQWSSCVGQSTIKGAGLSMKGTIHLTDLQNQPSQCTDDPCDPDCTGYVDNGTGIDAGSGLSINTDGGVTLDPVDGSTCSGVQTTVSGTVYDPAGNNPIYNAIVYVPSTTVDPFPPGVAADKCGGGGAVSGKPVAVAVTGPDGKFTLTNVPAGSNVPVVIQIGRWRRQVTVATVTPCADNAMPASDTHLPQNQSQGDIPFFAYVSGGADYLECLMSRIGIDNSEFTAPGGGGRVEFYQGQGGMALASSITPWYDQLLGNLATLEQYDTIVLSCMGGLEYGSNPSGAVTATTAHQNLQSYMSVGGRMFTSHWGREWIENGPAPAFPGVANWTCDGCTTWGYSDPLAVYVDTSTTKGADFKTWLGNVGVGDPFNETPTRFDVSTVIAPTTSWLYAWSDNNPAHGPGTQDNTPDLSFNTPLGVPPASQVGRVVFADTHVGQSAVYGWPTAYQFPDYCKPGAMDAQQKALEFLFFDLSACVTPPLLPIYPNPAVFTRDYDGVCPAGKLPDWRAFGWGTTTPSDSTITFSAQTASTQGGLAAATPASLGTASGAVQPAYTLSYVDAALGSQKSLEWLRVTITLNPSNDHLYAPTLDAWEQLYDCVDSL